MGAASTRADRAGGDGNGRKSWGGDGGGVCVMNRMLESVIFKFLHC